MALDGGMGGAKSWFTFKESPRQIDSPSFLPLPPPPTTCCSPSSTCSTVGGSSGIIAGSSKTGDATRSTVGASSGIVAGSLKTGDTVLARRGTLMHAFDGGKHCRSRTIKRARFIDGGLGGFINLSEQHCLLMLLLGGYPNLAVNDCATRRSACGSRRVR